MYSLHSSEDIIGVALGAKSVTLLEPDPIDRDIREVRPCMVVMVTSENNELELQACIVEKVLETIHKNHKDTDHYVPESSAELPHWMKFLLYKPEHEDSEFLMLKSEDYSTTNHTDGVCPGSLICTDDGCGGTVGMFIATIVKKKNEEKVAYHHGLTCQHVLFNPDDEHGKIKEAIERDSLLIQQNLPVDYYGCMLAVAYFPGHFICDSFCTVCSMKSGSDLKCDLELGKYDYGVFASCHEYGGEISTEWTASQIYKPDVIDLGSFSVSDPRQLSCCSLGEAQLVDDIGNWELFAGNKYADLFKHKLQPPQDHDSNMVEVFTCNIRSDGKLPKKCERRATLSIGSHRKFKSQHPLLASSSAVRNPQPNLPYIQLSDHGMDNKRGFATKGDSGSLLYMRVKRQHQLGQPTHKTTALVIGMLNRFHRDDTLKYSIIHGFYLQPALDIIASEVLFIDAHHFSECLKHQNAVAEENFQRKQEQYKKDFVVPKKTLKVKNLDDLEFTYEPCLTSCATHSDSVHSGKKYVLSEPRITVPDGNASNGNAMNNF